MAKRLFVVSGPSGAGKGTVIARVRAMRPDLALSVSATTRDPREGETDGVQYYFLDEDDFRRRVAAGGFLEWAVVHGNLYGTLRDQVESKLETGSLILEIDPQGARSVREQMPDCVTVFIAPPSLEELRRRLEGRASETSEQLERRMADAAVEMQSMPTYDEVIVNDSLDDAVSALLDVVERYEA